METPKKPAPPSDDIDLMRYVSLFISNWIWIVVALFLALSVAYFFNKYSARVYNVKSTLLIKDVQNTGAVANMEQIFAGSVYNPYPNLDDEVAILKSYTLNYRVTEEMPELHIAYVPVARNGIQGQRTYKTSPFVVKKLSDEQPLGVSMNIRFTGPDSYTVEVDEDQLEAWRKEHGTKSNNDNAEPGPGQSRARRRQTLNQERELKLGEVFNHNGFNFVIERRDIVKVSIWREQPLARLV